MPRRVYTYPEGLGWDLLNLVSTAGALMLASGVLVIVIDVVRSLRKQATAPANPWNAGTLEWLQDRPFRPWGFRSVPYVRTRYPLWDHPEYLAQVHEGRFYLPDAEEVKRETIVTSVLDAEPEECLRLPGPTFLTLLTAAFTGSAFILATFHLWWLALAAAGIALVFLLVWLWTGTATIPEKSHKDVGLGLVLPLYRSGPASPSWWAMFITMLADAAAFASLIFAYFFYWTSVQNFPLEPTGPEALLAYGVAAAAIVGTWALTALARRWNSRGLVGDFRLCLVAAVLAALIGGGALIAAPMADGLNPVVHSYPAMVWILAIWGALHLGIGIIMNLYCLARSFAGRLTPEHDIDIQNVALYWHFAALSGVLICAVVALFPHAV